jgi:hypothetical protein
VTAQVLPASIPLTATSNQSWLTITGIAGGVIGFSFSPTLRKQPQRADYGVGANGNGNAERRRSGRR